MWSNPEAGRPLREQAAASGAGRPALAPVAERYRRSQVLGLLLLAAVILVAVLLRADMRTLFPPGWWRF